MRRKLYRLLFLLVLFVFAFELPSVSQPTLSKTSLNSVDENETSSIIIVDMGSTGSRMHAYSMLKPQSQPNNSILELTEIAISKSPTSNKNTLGNAVADYINSPKIVSEHILPLYNDLAEQLRNQKLNINQIPIYFYATGGMRFHEQNKQQKLHNQIKQAIIASGHEEKTIISETISGELEGIFAWLSVNYKLNTLQSRTPTLAALDMGGASTQVALEYDPKWLHKKNLNLYTLNFNNKKYVVYSKSILGYGLTQTKKNITNYNEKQALQECHLGNYISNKHKNNFKHNLGNDINITASNNNQSSAGFNYTTCSKLIEVFLKNKKEHVGIAKAIHLAVEHNMKFVAASGYYYNFNFFNSKSPEDLITSIPDSCHLHRKNFRSKFPNLTEDELNEACFDATYLKILLNHAYHLPETYHNFSVPKHDIDWTIGAEIGRAHV